MDRRKFLQSSAIAGIATASINPDTTLQENENPILGVPLKKDKINIAFIGVGERGRDHLELALDRDDCNVVAICDIDPNSIAEAQKLIQSKGKKQITVYDKGEKDYLRLLEDKQIDAVIIATPWLWHSEMAINAMKAGKYTGVEVCGGFSLDECWELVRTHETTGSHLFFMENVCFRRDIMAVLNMVRANLFGELIHLECGYQHDLREVKFNDGKQPYGGGVEFGEKGFSEAKWRTLQSVHRNGDLYPTHGIGPVAQMIDINRGNRFLYLTSTSSKPRGLHEYVEYKGGKAHPNAKVEFKLGDVVTTVLKCNNGETIIISHDTSLPRPYSLGFRVQGTNGIWMDINKSIHIEGQTQKHKWELAQPWLDKHDHELWKKYGNDAKGAGHGGMDWFLFNEFVSCVKENKPAPFDAYDAATWLSITPLSEMSIASGSTPQAFPDFTRGRWTERKNNFAL
jgi:predicted dehydrogenase